MGSGEDDGSSGGGSLVVSGACLHSKFACGEEHLTTGMVTVQSSPSADASAAETAGKRLPLDVVLVIDQSGSMGGRKLKLVRETCELLTEELSSGDRLGMVSFDAHVFDRLSLRHMDGTGKAAAKRAIRNLYAGSTTNIWGGLSRGLEMLDTQARQDAPEQGAPTAARVAHVPHAPQEDDGRAHRHRRFGARTGSGREALLQSIRRAPLAQRQVDQVGHVAAWVPEPLAERRARLGPRCSSSNASSSSKPSAAEIQECGRQLCAGLPHAARCPPPPKKKNGRKQPSADILSRGHVLLAASPSRFGLAHRHVGPPPPVPIAEVVAEPAVPDAGGGRLRTVLLLTDGLANVGVRAPKELSDLASKHAAKVVGGARVFCFGYGNDHNSTMLTDIASETAGSYFFVENAEDVTGAFGDALGGLLSVVAKSITLTITPAGGARFAPGAAPLTKFKWEALPSPVASVNAGFKVHIPDVYSGEAKNVLVKISLPALPPDCPVEGEGDAPVLRAAVDFDDCFAGGAAASCETVVGVARPLAVCEEDREKDSEANVQAQLERFHAIDAMERAKLDAEKGDFVAARRRLDTATMGIRRNSERTSRLRSRGHSYAVDSLYTQLATDMSQAAGFMSCSSAYATGKHEATRQMAQYGFERNNSSTLDMNCYRTPTQETVRSSWQASLANKSRSKNKTWGG